MRRIALMFIAALVALIGLVPLASAAQAVPLELELTRSR